jgi:YidC/Oxa1 family membrane protein insertase
MQRNNIIVFAIIAVCVLAGWWFFLMPTDEERQKRAEEAKKAAEVRLAEAKEKAKQKKDLKKPDEKKPDEKKPDDKKPDDKKLPDPVKGSPPEEKLETVTLGGAKFHLTVDVISRGAGVRKVTLNRFEAANWRGRLPSDAEGKPTHEALELIQDDQFSPSYRVYHYLEPKDDNPVFGLGEENWKLLKPKHVEKDAEGNILFEEVSFSTMVPVLNVEIVKTYKLAPKDYHVGMKLTFTRDKKSAKAIPFRYQITGAQGLPIEGEWYTSLYRNAFMALVEPGGHVWRKLEDSSRISLRRGGDRFPEIRGDNRLQYAGVANQFFAAMLVVDDVQPDKADGGMNAGGILAWARPTLETTEMKGVLTKLDFKNNVILFSDDTRAIEPYYLLPRARRHLEEDLQVEEGQRIVLSFYTLPADAKGNVKRIATWGRLGDAPRPQFDDITMRVNSEVITLEPGEPVTHQFLLYHGPVKTALLAQFSGDKEVPAELVDRYTTTLNLNTLTDYPNDNWLGKVSSWIKLTDLIILVTRFMHWVLFHLHKVFGWGLSIVVLTVMVRGAMFPISRRQALFSIKMQELGPELKKIQEKYPDDPQAKMQATQAFYKQHGISPLGSCWPVFLQMPIFLGLYFAFQESIHFRLAKFWPLWIENLAAPDMLQDWSERIPWISAPDSLGSMLYLGPYLNILPMIAVVFMMIQQIQTMPPAVDDNQAAQQKMMKYMTIFFGVMFYKVAAGLCIYFISSSLWGLAERKLLPKKKPGETPGAPPSAAGPPVPANSPPPQWKGKNAKKERAKEKEKDNAPAGAIDKLKALWREILKAAEKK